jgi:hypothetical protein
MDPGDAGPILLVKNGSIVPFAALPEDQAMELHYFPKLAAEFFVFEPESNDYTLLHAGPAGDQMRLEIESKASRTYEWTVHHSLRAAQVMCNGRALSQVDESAKLDQATWHYDSRDGTLRIRVNVPTQKQSVVFVSFGTGGG